MVLQNMLQISDFFQCKAGIGYCIERMHITKDTACTHIKDALKKIEHSQTHNSHAYAKDCWFTLIQKCINVAAAGINTDTDIQAVEEL